MSQVTHQHVRTELAWLAGLLRYRAKVVAARGPAYPQTALMGLVIEDQEASALFDELSGQLSPEPATELQHETHTFRPRKPSDAVDRPLMRAAAHFQMELPQYVALLTTLAVELDARFGRLVAYLNDHAARTRPTLGLALALASDLGHTTSSVEFMASQCVHDGLLEAEGDGPFPDLSLRVAPDMLARLVGAAPPDSPAPSTGFAPPKIRLLEELVLSDDFRRCLNAWVESARRSPPPVTVLVGDDHSGRRTVAHALASQFGTPIVWADATSDNWSKTLRSLRREARWHAASPVLRLLGPLPNHEAATIREELHTGTPAYIAVSDSSAAASFQSLEGVPVLALPRLESREHAALWAALAPNGVQLSPNAAGALAARFRFGPGKVQRAWRHAAAQKAVSRDGHLNAEDAAAAARSLSRGAMEGLAQRLELPYTRGQLVVPDHISEELSLAVAWIHHRKKVMEEWGLGERVRTGRGLTMLLCGPPGTGKTMAAQVMARELGIDLFRLDLSSVMSKYIGETEKNLKRLFREAEEAGAAVLLDECEVLLSKRAEVRDARDKYANAEVGALLVMLEDFEGVSFLATNRVGDMDEAFTRRFPFILSFPLPDEQQRTQIWRGLLPRHAAESQAIDLAELGRQFKLSGGEIKNAVLAAAYAAAKDGKEIGAQALMAAAQRESRKKGRPA